MPASTALCGFESERI